MNCPYESVTIGDIIQLNSLHTESELVLLKELAFQDLIPDPLHFIMRRGIHTHRTLKITGTIWYERIVEKLEKKHSVSQEEVEEVLNNKPIFRFVEKGNFLDEDVYTALGHTDAGRKLIIFFIYKKSKCALIISARGMTDAERRMYEKD